MEGLGLGCEKFVKEENLMSFKIKNDKFENGLILVCSVKGQMFRYGGSFKESLKDEEVRQTVSILMLDLTFDYITSNKAEADSFLWRFDENQLSNSMFSQKK